MYFKTLMAEFVANQINVIRIKNVKSASEFKLYFTHKIELL